jgi:transmembrane sensor
MPLMDYNILIHKKLSGQITDAEQQQLEDWLASDPINQQEFDEIKLIWESAEEEDEEITDAHFNEEFLKLESAVQDSVAREKDIDKRRSRGRLKNIAIMILTIAVIYSLTAPFNSHGIRPFQLTSNELSEATLSDRSTVILNDSSSISFEESSKQRQITLKGEAFFQIEKDTRPFVVLAQGVNVSVTGTSFVVKAYTPQSVEVIVISGNVEVSFHDQKVLLTASEKSIFESMQGVLQKRINDDPNFNAWYTRKLEFNKTELREILKLIEELYDIKFTLKEEKVLGCRFTGSFDHAKLENVLKTLAFSMDIEFTSRIGNYYEVSGKGCVP